MQQVFQPSIMVLFNFFVFLFVVFVFFFVGASASEFPSSFPFIFSILSCFFPIVFFGGRGLYVFVVIVFSPPVYFQFFCITFLPSPMFFCFFLHVSRLSVFAVVVFVLIPPLSHLVFFFQAPACTWKGKQWKNKCFIWGFLRKCPFPN